MKLQITDLKTERQWRAATGLDERRFQRLLGLFQVAYESMYGQTVAARHALIEVTPSLTSEAELLYFTLFSLKSGLTYDLLGLVCGMDGANAKRNQELGLKVLQKALFTAGCVPQREFKSVQEFEAYFKKESTLILDGTEQRIQRPQAAEEQKACYSGKKRADSENPGDQQCGEKNLIFE